MSTFQSFPPPDPNEEAPRLFKMSAESFEYFCLDVARQNLVGVENADLYERKGLRQYGGDFYVDCGAAGLVIGSCKAHEKPKKDDIVGVEGAQKFIDHWESHWKNLGVTKFILCLAAEARDATRLSHIRTVKANIRALGIECEVWAQKELVDRCRNHEGIVRQYLGAAWVYRFCAFLQPFASSKEQNLVQLLYTENDDLRSTQTPLLNNALQSLQRLMRQSRRQEVLRMVAELKGNHSLWRTAEPRQKARILRTEAACIVETDLDGARALYASAATEDPPSDRYFDTILVLRSEGNAAARATLSNPRTARERRLKAALFIENGEPAEALSLLQDDEKALTDPQSRADQSDRDRLKAIAFLMLGDWDKAIVAADAAVNADGDHFAARQTRAVAYYSASLSPAARLLGMRWPSPYPLIFVKASEEAKRRRVQALSWFDELDALSEDRADNAALRVWRFADLVDDPKRHVEATQLLEASYDCDQFHPAQIMWALARRLKFNKARARRKLEKLASDSSPAPETIAALLGLYAELNRFEDARALLQAHEGLLSAFGDSLVKVWREELSQGRRRSKSAGKGRSAVPASLRRGLNLEGIQEALADDSRSPLERFEAASVLAERGSWDAILANTSFLLEEIGTNPSFRLVVIASANLRPASETLGLLEAKATQFCGHEMPVELARIRLQLRARTGDLPGALQEAQKVLSDPTDTHYLLRAQLEAQTGDFVAAGRVIGDAVSAGNKQLNDPTELIRWATILRDDDPRRATALLRRAKEIGLGDTAGQAATLALSLIPEESEPYIRALHDAATGKRKAAVRLASLDDVRDLMVQQVQKAQENHKLYDKGSVPGHMVFGDKLGLAYLAPLVLPGSYAAASVHIGHAVGSLRQQVTPSRLVLDVTAMLIAEGLELWPALRSSPLELFVPHDWSTAMLAMEHGAIPGQRDRVNANEAVVDLIADGRIRVVRSRPAHSIAIDLEDNPRNGEWPTKRLHSAFDETQMRSADIEILRGRTVFLGGGVPEDLQLRGCLRRLCQLARVCVDEEAAAASERQRDDDRVKVAVGNRLRSLRQTISDYVRSGRIRIAPLVSIPEDLEHRASPVESTLWSVLQHPASEGLALWIDDRFINGHSAMNELPIVTVRSVLSVLITLGSLTSDQSDAALRKLRLARHTFVQPTSTEIVRALAAWSHDETAGGAELDVLERAWAILVAQHQTILEKKAEPGIIEHQAVIDQYFLARTVFREILTNPAVESTNIEKAALWVFDKLRFDWRMGFDATVSPQAAESVFVGWALVLLLAAYDVELLDDARGRERAKRAIRAVYEERLVAAFDAAPKQLDALLTQLAETLKSFLGESDQELTRVWRVLTGRYVDCLPEPLQEALFENEGLVVALGVVKGAKIGDQLIPNADFWAGVAALRAQTEVLISPTDGHALKLSRRDDGSLSLSDGEETIVVGFPEPLIFHWNVEERFKGYKRIGGAMRLTSKEQEELETTLEGVDALEVRERALSGIIQNTVAGRVWTLSRFESGARISPDQIGPPPARVLAEWLGLKNGDAKPANGFHDLQQSLGVAEALARWLAVPVAVCPEAQDWFRSLSSSEATSFLTKISRRCTTIIAQRNVFDLISARDDLADRQRQNRSELLRGLPTKCRDTLDLAHGSQSQLLRQGCDDVPDLHLYFASWSWANTLHAAMGGGRQNLSNIARFFRNESKPERRGLVRLMGFDDVLNASRLTTEQLAAAVAGSVLHKTSEPLTEELKTEVASALTIQGDNKLPSVSLFSVAGTPNATGSWLGESVAWTSDFLGCDDPFARRGLEEPATLLREMVARREPELTAFAALGTRSLSNGELVRLIRHVRRRAPHFTMEELMIASTLLSRTRLSSNKLRALRNQAFQELARRLPNFAKNEERTGAATALAELSISALVAEDVDWIERSLLALRLLARCWLGHFETELLTLIALIAQAVPAHSRAPFWQLHTEIRVATRD